MRELISVTGVTVSSPLLLSKNVTLKTSATAALQPLVGFGFLSLLCRFRNSLFFMGWGCQPHAQPPTWRSRVSLFVWVITFDLCGMGDPISSYATASKALRII
jgi:hypothetical protein